MFPACRCQISKGVLPMKKLHAALILAASLILVLSLLYGGLSLFSGQQTLPGDTTVGGWKVGGADKETIRRELRDRLERLSNLQVALTFETGQELRMTFGEAGAKFGAEDFLNALAATETGSLTSRLKARSRLSADWTIRADWDIAALRQKLDAAWEQKAFGEPVNAERRISQDDRIRYIPEQTALRIDWNAFALALTAVLPGDFSALEQSETVTVKVPLAVTPPQVTVESLKKEGVERKIAEFRTSLGASGPGRTHNVEAAAKALNGTVLAPGDVFDYGKIIERAAGRYGFREAPVIVGGRVVPGTGGGICQVSSTLYNAALRLGLEIVERRNHSAPVNYLPKGLDATFASGSINFRFRNTTGKHLAVTAAVEGRTLTVKLFGTFPRNITYEARPVKVELIPPGDKRIPDPSLPPGATRIIRSGKPGYVVETVLIRRENGKITETKQLSRDVYRPQPRVIAVNPKQAGGAAAPRGSAKPPVEDGISARIEP